VLIIYPEFRLDYKLATLPEMPRKSPVARLCTTIIDLLNMSYESGCVMETKMMANDPPAWLSEKCPQPSWQITSANAFTN
jgi:hypothetical protein